MQPQSNTAPETGAAQCSFCKKNPAVLHSKGKAYRLCTECCYLFYPQIDIRKAEADAVSIEEACRSGSLMQACRACGVRSPQVFSEEGDYCLICAKRHKISKADKIASRMGLSPEEFDTFVQAVLSEEAALAPPEPETAQTDGRIILVGRSTVAGQTALIVADTLTGVQYLTNAQLSSFSPLLDADGKPLLYQS